MRKLLLAVLFSIVAVGPAAATDEIFGGDLIVEDEYAVHTPGGNEISVLVADYANITSFLGQAFANGGAANQAGNTITRLVADDLTPTGVHAGMNIAQWTFTMANLNAVAVTVRPRVRFHLADGAGGAPGTVITGFSFNPITVPALTVSTVSTTAAFPMPGVTFWAGLTFDDNGGTTGATAAQLNQFGQGIFSPPTVGSSTDLVFATTAAGSHLANNPAGATLNFGGTPPANFGWRFFVDEPVPANAASWGRVKAQYRD